MVSLGGDPVRCPAVADEESEGEGVTADVFLPPCQLRGCEYVREALGLLEREHAQREAAPRGDALALAAQAIVERRSENEEEVGLGLAAPGREPQGVDDSPCAVRRL